ncbi:MAG: alkane 1-monooxygenase [Bacteroidia bacterium]
MKTRQLKYLTVFTAPLVSLLAFYGHGWWTWSLVIYAFVMIPLGDAFGKQSKANMSEAEEEMALNDPYYDWMLYALVPLQYIFLVIFLFQVKEPGLSSFEIAGRVITMGIGCGVVGINLAHELGHRIKGYERFMSKALLLTTMYMHFYIEHNRGHHKNVSTEKDPASADRGEVVYFFWFKSIIFSYISAWHLEMEKLKKNGHSFFSIHNEMIRFQLIQLALLAVIYFVFGLMPMIYFLVASLIGILLLETINYVEHYGLRRKKTGPDSFEKVLPVHSWNSNHPIGRIVLFELTRHSDHHYKASRKYQVLRHFEEAPQMPLGYPAMVLMALVPPLWFSVMHKQIDEYRKQLPEGSALA